MLFRLRIWRRFLLPLLLKKLNVYLDQASGIPHTPPSRGWKKEWNFLFSEIFRVAREACDLTLDYCSIIRVLETGVPIPLSVGTLWSCWKHQYVLWHGWLILGPLERATLVVEILTGVVWSRASDKGNDENEMGNNNRIWLVHIFHPRTGGNLW